MTRLDLGVPAAVERGLGRLGPQGDGVHGEPVVADVGEHLEGRVEDLAPRGRPRPADGGWAVSVCGDICALLLVYLHETKRFRFIENRVHTAGHSSQIEYRRTGLDQPASCPRAVRSAGCAHAPGPDPARRLPRPARSTSSSSRRSRTRAGATTCSTTRRSPTPTSTSGCGGSRSSRRSSPSCGRPTRRPRRSAARSRPSSPPSTTSQRMESLDNAFSYEELESWHARLARDGVDDPALLCELKVDGLAINLLYEDGRLVRALTRGDGSHRRGRHAQRQDDRLGPAPADRHRRVPGAGAARGARRGVPARSRRSSGSTSR